MERGTRARRVDQRGGRVDRASQSVEAKTNRHAALETLIGAEESYTAALRRITASIARAMNRNVIARMGDIADGGRTDGVRLDATAPGFALRLRRSLADVRREVREEWPPSEIRDVLGDQADELESAGDATWILSVSEASGYSPDDLRQFVEALDEGGDALDRLRPDQIEAARQLVGGRLTRRQSQRERSAWIATNRRLTRSLLSEHLEKAGAELIKAAAAGATVATLRGLARERNAITKRRGDLIAQDQIQKGVGAQQRARSINVGAGRYTWRTQGDDRVRPEHEAREGATFSWAEPPFDGHPGEPVNCRCWAVPIVDG